MADHTLISDAHGDADTFPTVTYADWRALVEGAGGGPTVDDLGRVDEDGLRVEPLYATEHVAGIDPGWPAFEPFTRGSTALGVAISGWEVRQAHALDGRSVAEIRHSIRDDLEGGATALALSGIAGTGALAEVLADVDLLVVPIYLEPASDGLASARALVEVWTARGLGSADARGSFGLDPLGLAARDPHLAFHVEVALADAAAFAVSSSASWPGARDLVVDVRAYHDDGATAGQCVAMALATGVAYLRALEAAGLDVAAGAGRLRFAWSLDADVFGGAVMLRAARRAWARVLQACGAPEAARGMRNDVTTARRMLAERDPENNIVRGTLATLGAVLGGADAIVVRPYDLAVGAPASRARRIARTTQRVLMDEGQLNRVVDAAGGAFAVEARTEALARAAWARFQDIERAGGMVSAVERGLVTGWLAEAAASRAERLADGRQVVVGVNRYRGDGPAVADERGAAGRQA